ncbi:MAG: T9SS type A sorting domain-containing protein [Crocinitomicaceae bacterium]|tara:strand:- start:620 stop:1492 length:873 start_codon:yes stop_codon:yes gene_type:complete
MKHLYLYLLLSVIFIGFSTPLISQYQSVFGNESTKWESPFCNLDIAEIQQRVSFEDTIISNLVYQRIGSPIGAAVIYSLTPNSGNGLARENPDDGQVWYTGVIDSFQGYDTVEYLIMDLSLELGDNFTVFGAWGETDISTVDSVYYMFGLKHVRTTYQHWSNDQSLTFIEGVGTNYGLSYMHDHYNMCPCLISIEKDNDEIYLNNACNPPIVDINENKEGKVVLFPNPAKNNISINNLNFQGAYNISNVLGVVMMSGTYGSSSLSIDVGGLKKNIYFIEIDGLILKFIKE